MAKKWSDFASSSVYQNLSDEDKKEAQQHYYEKVIYPEVAGTPQAKTAKEQFLNEANPTLTDKAINLGSAAISGAANLAMRGIKAIPDSPMPEITAQGKANLSALKTNPNDPVNGSVMQGMDGAKATPSAQAHESYRKEVDQAKVDNAPIDQDIQDSVNSIPAMKPEGFTEIAGNALARTVKNTHSMNKAMVGLGLDVVGADDAALEMLKSAKRTQDEGANYPAQIEDFTHIKSWGDVPVYALEGILENSGMLAQSIFAGGIGAGVAKNLGQKKAQSMLAEAAKKELAKRVMIGSAVGASLSSIGMESGSIYSDIYQETGEMRPAVALAFGTIAGALDAIPAARAVITALGGNLAGEIGKSLIKRYGVEGLKQIGSEGITEFMQTWVEKGAVWYVDGKPFINEKNLIESVDAMLKGGAAGGGVHVAMQALNDVSGNIRNLSDEQLRQVKNSSNEILKANPQAIDVENLDAEIETRDKIQKDNAKVNDLTGAVDATELYGADPMLTAIQGGINAQAGSESGNVGVDSSTVGSQPDNVQGSVGTGTDTVSGTTETPIPSNGQGGAVLPASTGNDTVTDRPLASAADDFLPKMRTMTTDPKVIAQIDAELKYRGIDVSTTTGTADTSTVNVTPEVKAEDPMMQNDLKDQSLANAEAAMVGDTTNDVTAHEAATSPTNEIAQPTEAQKEAGNYKKGTANVAGLVMSIENPQGSSRSGVDKDGKAWTTTMQDHYGYVKGVPARSPDKEHIDTYIKAGTDNNFDGDVYVVDQKHPDGSFDEPKIMIGYANKEEADSAYNKHYADDWSGKIGVTQLSMSDFKQKLGDVNGFMKQTFNEELGDEKGIQVAGGATAKTVSGSGATTEESSNGNGTGGTEHTTTAKDETKSESPESISKLPTPQDGWEGHLIKTRLYARQLMDAGIMKRDAEIVKSIWSDHEKLLAKVHKAIDGFKATETTNAEVKAPETEKPSIAVKNDSGKDAKKMIAAHKRDFERTLFNAAISLDLGEAKNQVAFAIKHANTMKLAIDEMRKDATPNELSALDSLMKDGKPNLSLAFWKSVFKEAQKAAGVAPTQTTKLKNTGIELRRWWQLNKTNAGKAKDWKAIDKATTRAKSFNPSIAENADSNLQAYIDLFRTTAIDTFGDYLDRAGRFNTLGKVSKGMIQKINNFLNGDSYTLELGKDATADQRLEFIKGHATDYLDEVNKLNEALSGASTVAEFSQKIKSHMESQNLTELPAWIGYIDRIETFGADSYYRFDFTVNKESAPSEHKYFNYQAYKDVSLADAKKEALAQLNRRISDESLGKLFNSKYSVSAWYENGRNKEYLEKKAGLPNSGKKFSLSRPRLDKIERNGRKDYRKGKDVTLDALKKEFGLADVVFGEYVNVVQDQKHLNYAYDAMSDMADIMGLPKIAMGLGGKLHLAIGALGQGKAAAHYADNQPDGKGGTVHVINVTNTRGDGTVAHEWTHALDYHLKHYNPEGYKLLNNIRRDLSKFYNIELVKNEAKRFIFGGTYYPHMKKESKMAQAIYHIKSRSGGKPDTTTYQQNANDLGVDYWGNEREILARAGEAYIFDQLIKDNSSSDYLVTDWVKDGEVTKPKYRGTPYPEGEERTRFNGLFKTFFDSLKANKDGVVVDADKFNKTYVDPSVQFEIEKKELIENMPRYIQDWTLEREAKRAERLANQEVDKKTIDEAKRVAEAAEKAKLEQAIESALNPNNKTEALSDDDLNAIFDEAAAELTEAAAEQPNVIIGEPSVSDGSTPQHLNDIIEKHNLQDKTINKKSYTVDDVTPEGYGVDDNSNAKTAADLSLKAAKLGVKGIDEALSGLVSLFGGNDKGRLNSFPSGFDEEAYKKAKPHFEASLKAFTEAGKTLKDLFKFLIENLGLGVKPYAIQFAKDMQLGAQLDNDQKDNDNESTSGDSNGDGSNEEPRSDIVSGRSESEHGTEDSGIESAGNDGADRGNNGSVDGRESKSDTTGNEDGAGKGNRAGNSSVDEVSTDRGNNGLGKNFVIPQGGLTRQGSWKETADRNLDIIELVKKLEAEKRQATPAEQSLLSKYVGFGAGEIRNYLLSTNAFQRGIYRDGWVVSLWQPQAKRLKALLSDDEIKSIARTTQYAHFTSEAMTRGIWDGLARMGFTGGKVLEAGMGSGNFMGTIPASITDTSQYTGIEYDGLTASIAKQLYPEENIQQADYTETKLPNGFFDLTIGNPPFAEQVRVKNDPEYRKQGFALHDYFIAKSLDKVRDGGLAVFVTSKGTMDKLNDRARKYIAERADLVGAIRMPQTAFKENAGTETITDVLILRKRGKDEVAGGASWLGHKEIVLKGANYGNDAKFMVNEYFIDNPHMVLGDNASQWGQRGLEYTVTAREGSSIEADFAKAIKNLPENIYSNAKASSDTTKRVITERDLNPANKKEGGLYLDEKGKLMVVDSGAGVKASELLGVAGVKESYLKDYVKLRDALKQARYDQWQDGDWEASLKNLNKIYDAFVKKNGHLKSYTSSFKVEVDEDGVESKIERRRFKNWSTIKIDVEGTIAWAMETIDEQGNINKSKVLTGRTVKKPVTPKIETIQDALAVSLDGSGALNLDSVAELAKTTKDKVIKELGELIYETPSSEWQMRDEYLSGKVIDKLEEAEAAAKLNPRFERNVKALLAVQPKLLTANDVTATLGANWITEEVISEFAEEVMDGGLTVSYSSATSTWHVEGNGSRSYQRGRTNDWGTSDRSPAEMLDAVLNGKTIDIRRTDPTTKKSYLDDSATAAVNDIAKKMREKFKSWIWTDANRSEKLLALYNRKFNDIVGRTFDGSHLTLSGVSTNFTPHKHQLRAIWRVIQTGNTYLDHAVGSGKTFEMIASGMEQRRLGLIKRPMYVVPNHMLEQFASEFIEAYPTASIMVADKENFHTDNRRRFMAQAALNDPDAIIITHASFGRIGLTAENYNKIVDEQIDDLRIKLEEVNSSGDRVSIKKLEQQIEALEKKLKGKIDADSKDSAVTFEDIGVDMLYVDEAHEFRKLDFATNKSKVKGIDPNGSSRALDLYTKIRYLSTINPTRSHVFASGTPVTNTMGELYTIMKFFARDELENNGLLDFDAWSVMFGDVVADYEPNAAGRYELVERFAKFQNVPELMKRIRSFMDVLTSSDLGTLVKRPTIVGGSRKIVITPMPQTLKQYMDEELMPRITTSKKWKPSPDEPNNPDPIIAIIGDARLANIDMRFVDPSSDNDPDSKLNKIIDGIIETHNRLKGKVFTNKETGKPEAVKGATQIVFANVGFGDQVAKNRGFSAKDWVNKRLKEAGIQASEIAWMGDYDTSIKKEAMFMQMRSGEKKVLIGSPKNMGTGVNVQSRLGALHYLDAPWFPSDLEQPEGRIYRQGNRNEEIELYAYATKGSYDSSMWQAVARKGRFIEQAFNGDDSVRTLEDVSESSNYQMAAALASGDDRVIKLAGLEADVEKFNRLKNAHAIQQRELRTKKVTNDAVIRNIKERIVNIGDAEKVIGTGLHGEVKFTVNKKDFTAKDEAGTAIIAHYDKIAKVHNKNGDTADIGNVGGKFKLKLETSSVMGSLETKLVIHVTDKLKFTIDTGTSLADKDAAGLATRIINQVNRVNQMRYTAESDLEQANREEKTIKSKIGAQFEYQQELNEKTEEAARLKEELANTGDNSADQDSDDDTSFIQGKPSNVKKGLPVDTVENMVAIAKDGWKNAPSVTIVKNMQDPKVPESARKKDAKMKAGGSTGEPIGFIHGGDKIFIIADKVSSQADINEVILHEIFGHYGLRGNFGGLLRGILEQIVFVKNKEVRAKVTQYGYDFNDKRDRLGAAEEVLAEMAQTNPQLGFVKKAIALIRTWLRQNIKRFRNLEITDSEIINNILVPARNFVKTGKTLRVSDPLGFGTLNPTKKTSKGISFSLSDQTNSPEFKAWFGDSKVVDAEGKPLVVYHGTGSDFSEFSKNSLAHGVNSSPHKGFFFTDSFHAGSYAVMNTYFNKHANANIIPAYIKMSNPMILDRNGREFKDSPSLQKWVRANVDKYSNSIHDGIIINNIHDIGSDLEHQYIVFNPNQIKSAVGNNGNFDANNNDIRFSLDSNTNTTTTKEGGMFDRVLQAAGGNLFAKHITQPAYRKVAQLLDSKHLFGSNTGKIIKAGMIADYGLDEQYLDRRDEIEARMNQHLRKSKALIQSIAGLSRQESSIAYQWLQEKPDSDIEAELMSQLPADSVQYLEQIKSMIEGLSQEAITLGQLKPEQYERNKFAYLHRSYAKYELQDQENKSVHAGARRKILGDQYKGRGLKFSVDSERLDGGGANTPIEKGQTYKRLERRNEGGKLVKRVWWNADVPIPPVYSDMEVDSVAWEVMGVDSKGKATLWRDFTKPERERMGELDEAKFAVATTVSKMAHDIEMGKFFEFIDGQYAQDEPPEDARVIDNAGESMWSKANLIDALADGAWVKVPDVKVQGTDVAKYGAIAGKYVEGSIWNDIRQTMNTPNVPKWYQTLMRFWKISKTALSPAVHLNNVMANVVMADMHDVQAHHMVKAIEVLWKARKDPEMQKFIDRFEDSGAITGTYVHAELKDDMMKPLLEELRKELKGVQANMDQMHSVANAISVMFAEYHNKGIRKGMNMLATTSTGNFVAKIPEVMIETYQNEDVIFRLGAFIKGLEEGKTDRESGKIARKAFLDYRINAPWVQGLRQTVLPFVAFTYRMIPMYVETIRDKPWKLAKYMMVANALAALGMAAAGIGDDDDKEIQDLLPDDRKGLTPYMTQRQIPVGKDKNGNLVYLDTTRWIPLGDIFEVQGDSSNTLPIVGFASPSGVIMILGDITWNRSRFSGRDVWKKTDTTQEASIKIIDQLWKGMMPNNPMLPWTYSNDKISNAWSGKVDMMGREYSMGQALASSFGIKINTYDKKLLGYRKQQDKQSNLQELKGNMRSLAYDYARKGISEDKYNEKIENEKKKYIDEANR